MKILLISDTHGITGKLKDEILPKYANEVQMAIHLGDYVKDLFSLQSNYPNLQMIGVGGSFEPREKTEQILDLGSGNKRILIMHGHTHSVKSDLSRIMYYAQEKGVDACFFGHTHETFERTRNGIFFMNPGSLTHPRGSFKGSIGLVSISQEGQMSGEVIFV